MHTVVDLHFCKRVKTTVLLLLPCVVVFVQISKNME
jgi:hypothetical protein